ncbi:hypothetical protein ACFP1Z_09965 [Streptomyces gamaensis]|uniref:SnoaL-like domain-containing protein n=1 Tax=Streptomyces gamaensis TaxID=1763542 RepID=A0ABW0YVB2_9ACTN
MSAQPADCGAGTDPRVPAIPCTINSIGDILSGADRAQFYREVLAAERGEEIDAVLEAWWTEAVLSQVPGRDASYRNAVAGRRLVPLRAPGEAR